MFGAGEGGGPRWPSTVFFRWEDGAGPRDMWDALPFPLAGPNVFGRLLNAVSGSSLIRGRGVEGGRVLSLSAALSVGPLFPPVPLKSDEDVEKAVGMWQPPPGTAGVITIAVREEEGAAAAAVPPLSGGEVGSPPPPPRRVPTDVTCCRSR